MDAISENSKVNEKNVMARTICPNFNLSSCSTNDELPDDLRYCSSPDSSILSSSSESDFLSCAICHCDQPRDGSFFVSCDQCHSWYHGPCVNLSLDHAKLLATEQFHYQCPGCLKSSDHHCPLCQKGFHKNNQSGLWQHINQVHISRNSFPPLPYFIQYSRFICSANTCRWAFHARFSSTGCKRSLGDGTHCNNPLQDLLHLSLPFATSVPPIATPIPASPVAAPPTNNNVTSCDRDIALQAIVNLGLDATQLNSEKSFVDNLLEEVMLKPVTTISHVPRSIRPLLAEIMSQELRHASSGNIWGCIRLLMLPKATLGLPPRDSKTSHISIISLIRKRLLSWKQGNIGQLWENCIKPHQAEPHLPTNQNNLKRALHKGKEGHYGKAIQCLLSPGIALPDDPQAIEDLNLRHPQSPLPNPVIDPPAALSCSPEQVRSCLSSFPKGSSPGGSHLRIQHLVDICCHSTAPSAIECLNDLTRWLNVLLAGSAHPLLAPWLSGAPLIALCKKKGGFRPIAVGEIFSRLVGRLCCHTIRPQLAPLFLPQRQFGVGIRGGMEAIIHSSRYLINKHQEDTDFCLLKLDFQNAFNECHRQTMLSQIHHHFPELLRWVQWSYCCAAELRFGNHRLLSSTGVCQGDPLGPLLFCLTLSKLIEEADPLLQDIHAFWYLDDGSLIGPRHNISQLYNHILSSGPALGLHLNPSKCKLFWPSGDPTFPEFPDSIIRLTEGITLLGTPLWGSDSFFSHTISQVINQTKHLHSLLPSLEDPQVELHILRSCLSFCKINHLLRTVPPDIIIPYLPSFDTSVRSTLADILHGPISDQAWLQASLPFSFGGLGLRSASRSAAAGFFSSCLGARHLIPYFLDDALLTSFAFPGEISRRSLLSNLLLQDQDLLDETPSQATLHFALDQLSFRELLSNQDLRNRARLLAISESRESSGWLKAAPLSSLGLAMPCHEFTTSLRLWLGIPITSLPSSSICPCSATLDQYGDHLLGCKVGPYRIRRHNALRDIIYYTLKQDNPNVRLEQPLNSNTREKPGDIYHPDFIDSRPTYFDITIRNTTQPGLISSASSNAGAAAASGESSKDAKYNASVSAAGGVFIPLAVETFGLWTPFAVKTLKSIASRSTLHNGLTAKDAFKNLIQQLSIKLWSYNSKLILNYLATLPPPL